MIEPFIFFIIAKRMDLPGERQYYNKKMRNGRRSMDPTDLHLFYDGCDDVWTTLLTVLIGSVSMQGGIVMLRVAY
jgi:hypothetical protein